MNMALALPGNSDNTVLTHLLARGLKDERYMAGFASSPATRVRTNALQPIRIWFFWCFVLLSVVPPFTTLGLRRRCLYSFE